jgi:uncharacterized membrane protein YccC
MANYVTAFNRVYQAGFSRNLVERPRLDKHLQKILNDVVKMRGLITPASKETHIQKAIFEAIQTVSRNMVCAGATNECALGFPFEPLRYAQCQYVA